MRDRVDGWVCEDEECHPSDVAAGELDVSQETHSNNDPLVVDKSGVERRKGNSTHRLTLTNANLTMHRTD